MPDGAQAWKVIKTPGSHTNRIAQACDRCRSKKVRCDGKRPNCSQCEAVGFECKISDRLSRRAFPRGYTESLEDRIRQLESENTRLLSLLDIRDEQMEILAKMESLAPKSPAETPSNVSNPPNTNTAATASQSVSASPPSSTTSKLSSTTSRLSLASSASRATSVTAEEPPHDHQDGQHHTCCSNYPHKYKTKPVGGPQPRQEDEDEDFETRSEGDEPGLDNKEELQDVACEGTYRSAALGGPFMPLLVEKLQTSSPQAAAVIPAAFAALHEPEEPQIREQSPTISGETPSCSASVSPSSSLGSCCPHELLRSMKFPSRVELDQLIARYFREWNVIYPVFDQYVFLQKYVNFTRSMENDFCDGMMIGHESFAVQVLLVSSLAALTCRTAPQPARNLRQEWMRVLAPDSPFVSRPSLQNMQLLCLALLYSLHAGSFEDMWRFRMYAVTMQQMLGLNRCPKALVGPTGKALKRYEMALRRRLFWTVYTLDCFASVAIGAPRLIHEQDIECALPREIMKAPVPPGGAFSAPNSLELSFMRLACLLGCIIDTFYSCRSRKHYSYKTIIKLEDRLECWRRDLPAEFVFDLPAAGVVGETEGGAARTSLTHEKAPLLTLLYFYAKVLIHLPGISHGKDVQARGRGSSSYIAVVGNAKAFLQTMNWIDARGVPTVCLSPARTRGVMMLIVMYGAVDYSRGGALFQELKGILNATLLGLARDTRLGWPGHASSEALRGLNDVTGVLFSYSGGGGGNGDTAREEPRKKKGNGQELERLAEKTSSQMRSAAGSYERLLDFSGEEEETKPEKPAKVEASEGSTETSEKISEPQSGPHSEPSKLQEVLPVGFDPTGLLHSSIGAEHDAIENLLFLNNLRESMGDLSGEGEFDEKEGSFSSIYIPVSGTEEVKHGQSGIDELLPYSLR